MIQENWSEKILSITGSLTYLLPEWLLTALLIFTILVGLFQPRYFSFLRITGIVCYIACGVLILMQWPHEPVLLFQNMLRWDDFSSAFQRLILAGSALTLVITPTPEKHKAEYLTLLHAITLGASLLVMSMNFIIVVIALELISLPAYVLAGVSQQSKSAEGSLKYFLFGTVATAVLIYGMSLLYGETITLDFSSERFVANLVASSSPLVLIGGLLVVGGLLSKIAAAPFHFWAPDLYEASPTAIVAFFSVVPKLAGLAILIKIVLALQCFGQTPWDWITITSVISIVTMIIGNASALLQTNIKRMMGYSSIAQSGFLMMGLAVMNQEGIQFIIFYALAFLLANVMVFLFLIQLENHGEEITFTALKGKGKSWGAMGILVIIGLISLTGLPPTAGFTGKLLLFSALWESYSVTGKTIFVIVLIVGLINTVVSLFFYLKIPYYLYLKEPDNTSPQPINRWRVVWMTLGAGLLIYLFLQPQVVMQWITSIESIL